MKSVFAGYLLFAQFGHYFDMEVGMRMSFELCGNRFPRSPQAELYSFKIKPLLVRLYLHSRPEVRRHKTNHLYHTALEGAHHHNCNYNYSLRAVRPRGKHQPDKQKTLHSENFFLQLLTPPTEETNGGPTG